MISFRTHTTYLVVLSAFVCEDTESLPFWCLPQSSHRFPTVGSLWQTHIQTRHRFESSACRHVYTHVLDGWMEDERVPGLEGKQTEHISPADGFYPRCAGLCTEEPLLLPLHLVLEQSWEVSAMVTPLYRKHISELDGQRAVEPPLTGPSLCAPACRRAPWGPLCIASESLGCWKFCNWSGLWFSHSLFQKLKGKELFGN